MIGLASLKKPQNNFIFDFNAMPFFFFLCMISPNLALKGRLMSEILTIEEKALKKKKKKNWSGGVTKPRHTIPIIVRNEMEQTEKGRRAKKKVA